MNKKIIKMCWVIKGTFNSLSGVSLGAAMIIAVYVNFFNPYAGTFRLWLFVLLLMVFSVVAALYEDEVEKEKERE